MTDEQIKRIVRASTKLVVAQENFDKASLDYSEVYNRFKELLKELEEGNSNEN